MRDGGDAVKKSVANHRSEIASLKRRIQDLEAAVKRLAKAQAGATGGSRAAKPEVPEESSATGLRFRAKGMAANRKRLGLSAEDFGLLVGATGKSIYS